MEIYWYLQAIDFIGENKKYKGVRLSSIPLKLLEKLRKLQESCKQIWKIQPEKEIQFLNLLHPGMDFTSFPVGPSAFPRLAWRGQEKSKWGKGPRLNEVSFSQRCAKLYKSVQNCTIKFPFKFNALSRYAHFCASWPFGPFSFLWVPAISLAFFLFESGMALAHIKIDSASGRK